VAVSALVGYLVTQGSGGADLAGSADQQTVRSAGRAQEPSVSGGGGAAPAPGSHPAAAPSPNARGFRPFHRGPSGVPTPGQSVIKTARVFLRIPKDTFKARFDQATRIAETYGGYVQSSSTSGTGLRTGGLVVRIPADNFERALTDLRGLGRVVHQTVEGRDVSAQFVDLQARLRNARAEESVLLRLLRKAPTVEASLRVQDQLSETELQIEELEGQIRFLQHRAALSTIDVELSERVPHHHRVTPPTHTTFGEAWRNAVDGFFGVVTTVVIGLGYVVPIGLLLAVAWLVFRRVRDRAIA
jgi:hypothetical protein